MSPPVPSLRIGVSIAGLVFAACTPGVQTTYPASRAPTRLPHGPVIPQRIRTELPKICRLPDIAWLDLQISANGKVTAIGLIDATTPEFGEAAVRLLQTLGAWGPALDANGEPVPDTIRFALECATCDTVFCGDIQLPGKD